MPSRLPAEWEPQNGVMLTWPHAGTDWSDNLHRVEPVFCRIGKAIALHEKLLSVCQNEAHAGRVREMLLAEGAPEASLRFVIAPANDTWARDHGPITIETLDGMQLLNFHFNGWGGKYAADLDDQITPQLENQGAFGETGFRSVDFILEGGAIETDGRGTLLASKASVLNSNRNPGWSQQQIENLLHEELGLDHFLWLTQGGFAGDDTDSHIDTLARFVGINTVVYATTTPDDPNYAGLEGMRRELEAFRNRDGDPLELAPLPPPGIHHDADGRQIPATYANFLIINDALLLPVYGVANDDEAVAILSRCMPDRTIVPIDCRPIIEQNGSLHCLTMQFPKGVAL